MKREAAPKLCALFWLLFFRSVTARWRLSDTQVAAGLPSGRDYILQNCEGHWQIYESLIASALSPHKANSSSIDSVLYLQGRTPKPQVLVLNNTVRTFEEPANNTRSLVALLAKLTTLVSFPDFVLVSNTQDEPENDILRHGGPWFGYCNHLMVTSNILYPASTPVKQKLSCGDGCMAFEVQDTRQAKAVFLGSSTGWPFGRRRAAVLAGIEHSDNVYSGYTQLVDISQETRDSTDPAIHQIRPAMSMLEQVQTFKYIINADGNCAALRLRSLLASDSVVFWVESNQVEWFYSLLQPFVHYVPICYDAHDPTVTAQDILLKLRWAEDNPTKMAAIVYSANEFAKLHLSEHGLTCYSVQLFNEYLGLYSNSSRLRELAAAGNFDTLMTHK